jgi:hypothetical protein
LNPAQNSLDDAIRALRDVFENGQSKAIAKQNLCICKQAPGEGVFPFANRLQEAVRAALSGDDEAAIQNRVLDEFLDRLVPELQFQVKSHMPDSFGRAYELAQHFELLLEAKKPTLTNNPINDLTKKVEAMAVYQSPSDIEVCFYCRRHGHFIKDCRSRQRDEKDEKYGDIYDNKKYRSPNQNREGSSYHYRSQSPRRNYGESNYSHNQNRGKDTDYSWERRHSNERSRPPTPKVHFREPEIKVMEKIPFLFAMITVLSLFGTANGSQINPMICLPNAPSSIWRFPDDPICQYSHWRPNDVPIPFELTIHRVNTIKNKTPTKICKCIIKVIKWIRCFWRGFYKTIEHVAKWSDQFASSVWIADTGD